MLQAIPNSIERIAYSAPHQWLYLFGEEGGVVYSEAQGRFAGLNAAGVAAFLAYDAEIRSEGVDASSLQADLHQRRLRGAMESIRDLSRGIFPLADSPEEWPAFDPGICANRPGTNVEIGGIPVLIQYPAGPLERLYSDYFRNCDRTSSPPRCCLSVQQTERGWAILVNGRAFLPIEKKDQLGLGLMHAARCVLYHLGSYDVAFHAAMVAQGDCGLLLCAPRESGKSTLAAYLAAKGFDLLADEPALLQLDSWSVQSVPLPISLKEGSWSCLQEEWPQLGGAPVHVRSDGVPIRLLHPPAQRVSPRRRRLTHFVFPRYSPSSAAQPERLSPLSALCLLNTGGMLFARSSTRENFESFLNLLCQTPAFTLPFSSLAGATHALSAACTC
jgi:hypothetical protein